MHPSCIILLTCYIFAKVMILNSCSDDTLTIPPNSDSSQTDSTTEPYNHALNIVNPSPATIKARQKKAKQDNRILDHQARTNPLTHTCAHPDAANNPSCRKIKFKCIILKNEHIDKPQYISADEAPSCETGLNAKVEGDDAKYRWTIKFTPKGGEDYNRQFRYVIANRNDIPAALIRLPENRGRTKLDFGVDLSTTESSYICSKGAKLGRKVDEDDDDCSKSDLVSDWLKDKDNSRGVIKIDIQDVTYCFTQNTKSRDTPSSQTDCSDPQAGSFRSQRVEINYDLNCKRDEWWGSVGAIALDALSAWTPWLRGVSSEEAKKQVFGCK